MAPRCCVFRAINRLVLLLITATRPLGKTSKESTFEALIKSFAQGRTHDSRSMTTLRGAGTGNRVGMVGIRQNDSFVGGVARSYRRSSPTLTADDGWVWVGLWVAQ